MTTVLLYSSNQFIVMAKRGDTKYSDWEVLNDLNSTQTFTGEDLDMEIFFVANIQGYKPEYV